MKKFEILSNTIRKEEEKCKECGKPIIWEGQIPFGGFVPGKEPWCTCDGNTMDYTESGKICEYKSHSSWDYPNYLVRNIKNGREYKIVAATPTHYCLESVEADEAGRKDKRAVLKDDPYHHYIVLGYYD